jgi:hypothetical protein
MRGSTVAESNVVSIVQTPREGAEPGFGYISTRLAAAVASSAFRKFSDDSFFTKNRIHASFLKSGEPASAPSEPVGREQETEGEKFYLNRP